MARQWRIEFEGALYHILSRGNQQQDIFLEDEKDNRDLLIYFLWEIGMYTNREIGKLLGLTYSSISRRVSITKGRLNNKRQLNKNYQNHKSLIKV